MFAFPASQQYSYAPQGYYRTPSSYERYQAALAEAEMAREGYLRELAHQREQEAYARHIQEAAFFRPTHYHHHHAATYSPETLLFEEQLRRRQKAQLLERARREQAARYFQDELNAIVGLVAQESPSNDFNNYGILRRRPHVRRSPEQPQLIYSNAVGTNSFQEPGQFDHAVPKELAPQFRSTCKPMGACVKHHERRVPSAHPQVQDDGIESLLKLVLGYPYSPERNLAPPTSAPAPLKRFSGVPAEGLAADVAAASSSSQASATPTPFDFGEVLKHLLDVHPKPTAPVAKPSSSAPGPSSSTPPSAPAATIPQTEPLLKTAGPSLKAALEARLNNEYESEIRDTIQAIFESLKEPQPSSPASSAAEKPAVTSIEGKGKGKGKGKDTPPAKEKDTQEQPSSSDIVRAMDTLTNIEASFRTLMEDFDPKSLSNLVFTTPPSYITNDEDSDASTDSTSRLAYTARNGPVRFYIHSLNGILAQLDAIESYGNDELRRVRKEIVGHVEGALEDIENEVGVRLRMYQAKEKTTEANTTSAQADLSSPVESATLPIAAVDKVLTAEEQPVSFVTERLPPFEQQDVAFESTLSPTNVVTSEPTSTNEPSYLASFADPIQPPVREHKEVVLESDPSSTNDVTSEIGLSAVSIPPSCSETGSTVATEPSVFELGEVESTTDAQLIHDNETPEAAKEESSSESLPEEEPIPEPEDLSVTVTPANITSEEPEPFLSAAFPDPPVQPRSSNTNSSSEDDAVVVEDVHSDWSEVEA